MIDPHTGADLSRTDPRMEPNKPIGRDADDRMATFLVPLTLAVLVLLGITYFFYGSGSTGTHVRADSGAVTKSEPSSN